MKVEAKGFAELDRLLATLPENMARTYLVDAVQAGADLIADEAARRAPKDKGDLAASIRVKMTKQRWIPGSDTGGGPRAEIGPSKKEQHIGMFQEFGTVSHAAHPFLRPAMDTRGQDAIDRMRDVLKSRLDNLKVPTL